MWPLSQSWPLIQEAMTTGLMDDGKTVDVVYLDFAKKFNSGLIFKADALSQEARIKRGALQGPAI